MGHGSARVAALEGSRMGRIIDGVLPLMRYEGDNMLSIDHELPYFNRE